MDHQNYCHHSFFGTFFASLLVGIHPKMKELGWVKVRVEWVMVNQRE